MVLNIDKIEYKYFIKSYLKKKISRKWKEKRVCGIRYVSNGIDEKYLLQQSIFNHRKQIQVKKIHSGKR